MLNYNLLCIISHNVKRLSVVKFCYIGLIFFYEVFHLESQWYTLKPLNLFHYILLTNAKKLIFTFSIFHLVKVAILN